MQAGRPWKRSDPVHFPEVEHGPFGGSGSGRGPGVACGGAANGFGCWCECSTARVRLLRCIYMSSITFLCRLNAHLSSIVSSKPFQMPVDVVPCTTALAGSRLSSFGFSGTIAHGAFVQSLVSSQRSVSSMPVSLYRSRHNLPRVKNVERLYMARGVGRNPL